MANLALAVMVSANDQNLEARNQRYSQRPKKKPAAQKDLIRTAARDWLLSLQSGTLDDVSVDSDALIRSIPTGYNVYPPMLLLPSDTFNTTAWKDVFARAGDTAVADLWQRLATATRTTRIAVNARIPQSVADPESHEKSDENIVRRPTDLVPLYGEFGSVQRTAQPSQKDIDDALWVSTVQNGITQIWAPRYTMFSRGNIKEKARLLTLPSITDAAMDTTGCTGVDLYSGIGYFAFSYAKAGMRKVLCFEINPWSVEGMRRGVRANKWESQVFKTMDKDAINQITVGNGSTRAEFLIFNMDNSLAEKVVKAIKVSLPPIRHVNCGLLPTSKQSWEQAMKVLDIAKGGWIHVHENLRIAVLDGEVQQIRDAFQVLAKERAVNVEHVERVKTYAPGIMHCVLDIHVAGIEPS